MSNQTPSPSPSLRRDQFETLWELKDQLRSVRRIVTHANCADGVASALILHQAVPDAEVMFLGYNSREHETLKAESGLLFCDFTPPRPRADEFLRAHAIVLDHHEFARDIIAPFERSGLGLYTDRPGESGAWLAYGVWLVLKLAQADDWRMPWNLATLAGIRDTWQRQDPRWREACEQGEALRFFPTDLWLKTPMQRWGDAIGMVGPTLYRKRLLEAERHAERAYFEASRYNISLAFVPTLETSDVADLLGDKVQIIVGFEYVMNGMDQSTPVEIQYSLRSRGRVNLGRFCTTQGGGGHQNAAGFSVPCLASRSPIEEFMQRFDRFGDSVSTRQEK